MTSAHTASNFGFTNHDIYTPAAYDSPQDRNGQYVDEAITLTFEAGISAAGQQTSFEFYTSLNGDQGANDMLIGTSGADILNGRNGDDVIIGLNGDDNIWGGQGNDHFIFSIGMGQDTINDFVAGAGTDDIIELRGFAGESFEQLVASATHDPQGTTRSSVFRRFAETGRRRYPEFAQRRFYLHNIVGRPARRELCHRRWNVKLIAARTERKIKDCSARDAGSRCPATSVPGG